MNFLKISGVVFWFIVAFLSLARTVGVLKITHKNPDEYGGTD